MISAILIVRNEEKNIEQCLKALRWVDEIVVVDQSSTDRTREIAAKYTDKIFVTENKGYCEPDRKVAESKASGEWILYMDADEIVSPKLEAEIKREMDNPRADVYYIPRKNYFLGGWVQHSGWYPAYVPRFFRKGKIWFPEDIHVDMKPLGSFLYLKNDIIHHPYDTLEEYFDKFNRYTSRLAVEEYGRGVRIRWYNMPWHLGVKPLLYFVNKYIKQQGFKDGRRGLLIAYMTYLTVFMQYIKVWGLEQPNEKT
jgi:glycosyltransferase involved in cell wall biosynthesis